MSDDGMSAGSEARGPVIHRTFWGRVLCGQRETREAPEGVLHIAAEDRHSRGEIAVVGAFIGLWSFAAVGCVLPWTGDGGPWWRLAVCALAWWPAWFAFLQCLTITSGGLALILERQQILSHEESRVFAEMCACVLLSVLAVFLATEAVLVCEIVGWIWLLALTIEGIGRGLLWMMKLAVVRRA